MRIELAVTLRGEETTRTATAYRTAVPQLVTHRRVGREGEPGGEWDVTHVPTGLKVTFRGIRTRTLAKAFAAELTGLDWTFTPESIPKGALAAVYGRAVNSARVATMEA